MALFQWWYGAGWVDQRSLLALRLDKIGDFFSIPLLVRTLFQPFRQISAETFNGPLNLQMRLWFDNLFSRFFGAFMRTFMIIIGGLWWLLNGLVGVLWLLLWPLFPALPLVGFWLAGTGLAL